MGLVHAGGRVTGLSSKFTRAKWQGFLYIELDNPDSYSIEPVLGAIDLAQTYGLKVIAVYSLTPRS